MITNWIGWLNAHTQSFNHPTTAAAAAAVAAGKQQQVAAKRKVLEEEAIPMGGDGFELLPPSPSVPTRLLQPYLDPQHQQQQHHHRPQSPTAHASLVPKPLSAVVLPPSPTPPQAQQAAPQAHHLAAEEAAMAVSPLMQRPAPGSYVPCQPPPAFVPHQPPPPPQEPQPQQPQQQQLEAEAAATAAAAAAAAVVEVPTTPGEGFPTLERRRELMDLTIAKLKADMEAVRASEGA
jgi:hypothetical protein